MAVDYRKLDKAGKIAYLKRPDAPNYKAGWYLILNGFN